MDYRHPTQIESKHFDMLSHVADPFVCVCACVFIIVSLLCDTQIVPKMVQNAWSHYMVQFILITREKEVPKMERRYRNSSMGWLAWVCHLDLGCQLYIAE